MKRFKTILLSLSALVLVSLVSCGRSDHSSGPSFITATGKFRLFDGQMTLAVFETPEGGINYTITRGTSAASLTNTNAPIRKGSPWFIYPAAPDSVWVYYGDEKNVLLIEFSEKDSKFMSNEVVPDLVRRAPAVFRDRLPPNLNAQ